MSADDKFFFLTQSPRWSVHEEGDGSWLVAPTRAKNPFLEEMNRPLQLRVLSTTSWIHWLGLLWELDPSADLDGMARFLAVSSERWLEIDRQWLRRPIFGCLFLDGSEAAYRADAERTRIRASQSVATDSFGTPRSL